MSDRVEQIKAAYRCGNSGCPCQRGRNVHCPLHADPTPSLGIDPASKPGKLVVVNCRANCDSKTILQKIRDDGFNLSDDQPQNVLPFAPKTRSAPKDQELVKVYLYTDAAGHKLYEKGRFEYGPINARGKRDKTFKWRKYGQTGWAGFDGTVKMEDIPLYHVQTVQRWVSEGKTIYFVEGEAAADALTNEKVPATCAAWGASQKDFGTQLQVFEGANVVLWPDNDEAGRMYMHKIGIALKGIAKSIRYCTPPLPEKGDAADYFAAGGKAEDLEKDTPPIEAAIDRISHDHVLVRYPTTDGVMAFEISDMEREKRGIDCELEVRIPNRKPVTQRINLMSSSARDGFRRDLDSLTGTKDFWHPILLEVFGMARSAFLDYDRSVRIGDIEDVEDMGYLIETLVPDGDHSVIFADGSAGKTFLTYLMAVCVAAGIPCLGYAVKKRPVLILDYETNAKTAKYRLRRICLGLRELGYNINPVDLPIYYWHARGIPLPDQADALKRKVEADGIGFVIVDSAAAACGGEPEDAHTALRYFTAGLDKLGEGVTTLTIAHIAKGGDTERPFGSAFWHNQPRRTWFVDRNQMSDSDTMAVTLHCRKVNDGQKPSAIGIDIQFGGIGGAVRFNRTTAVYTALSSTADLVSMVYRVLATPKSLKQLTEGLMLSDTAIRKVLQDPKNAGRFKVAEGGGVGRGNATYYERIEEAPLTIDNVHPIRKEPDYPDDFEVQEEDVSVPF